MCQYFSKTKDKEVFEKNKHHYDTMKTIAKAYLAILSVLTRLQFVPFSREKGSGITS